jgi:hypothetical protein
VPGKVLAQLMGHAKVDMTLNRLVGRQLAQAVLFEPAGAAQNRR